MKTHRVLILEDDLETLANILSLLQSIEQESIMLDEKSDIAVTVFSEYTEVEKYVNKADSLYDLILLDRDCKLGGSFHVIDIEKVNPDRIIAISSVPEYNKQAQSRGVNTVVGKDYSNLTRFSESLKVEIIKKLELKIK